MLFVFPYINFFLVSALLLLLIFFSSNGSSGESGLLDLPEGSPCKTKDAIGTCVKMHTCSILIVDIMDPDGEKVYPEICSFDGDTPIICCTSCNGDLKVDNISDVVFAPSGIMFQKTKDKIFNKCLDYSKYAKPSCWLQGGVRKKFYKEEQCHYLEEWYYTAAGGMDADRELYTHMALLGYGTTPADTDWLCGGSLISEHFILTAAHCTVQPLLGSVAYAALGILKRSDPEELWQKYKIKDIITHPAYKSPSKYHDIALLKTETDVKFNDAVYPACLILPRLNEDHFEDVTAIGWGNLGNNKPVADTLQVIYIEKFFDSHCRRQYGSHRLLKNGYDNTTQMCYGKYWNAVDTCRGDSGGPLQTEYVELCMFALIGITSFGHTCGIPGKAGVYTRVSHYVPWIESVVWPEDYH